MRVLRNVFRRRLRAFLTIFGITIGVLALVVMGAMAEKMQLLVDGGTDYYADKVSVTAESGMGGFGTDPLPMSLIDEIESVDGVARASGSIGMMLDEEPSAVSMGVPANIQGTDFRGEGYDTYGVDIAQGRHLEPSDIGKVVVGADLIEKLDASVGGTVQIRGEEYEVVGIMEKTLSAPDMAVMMPLAEAQHIFAQQLPPAVRDSIDEHEIVTGVTVYPEAGVDPDALATTIENEIGDVTAMGPAGFKTSVEEPLKIFNQIIYAIALLSLVIGGLSVINTMTMAVAERTREIGIRKSIGATRTAVLRQFVSESAVIGLLGGLAGLGLGAILVYLANSAGAASATRLFLITERLAIGSVAFAMVLGVLAGLYPAWHASSLNPVKALRYE
ncbi:MAG: ABC transporter permease [Coriobacteriia bacterium]|nr:ABC transporter permease [Coriobacteriia bacterium]